jgi:2-polyprenyl-6-hydroxyphenyl methylase/3-demethylubiquinone-9 3-methyltransferase
MKPIGTLQPIASAEPVACKICQGPSALFGVIDFHKSCIEAQGKRLPVSGYPIYYRRCALCCFTFTTAFDGWSHADFREQIYNDDYIVVDPDFVELRPTGNANGLADTFKASRTSIDILDYGGGSGLTASLLRKQGFSATTYDPFSEFDTIPTKPFDLISCFEVMEHVPSPKETVATMVSLLKDSGAILFSTLVQPAEFESIGLNWWYAGPRNGHVSLYSKLSLAHLFQPYGMKVSSFNEGVHIAYREIPSFATHLLTAA